MHELPFQTFTQLAALVLTLIAGWFLGLASSSGGRKWRERFLDEQFENAGYRDRAESDLRDAARRIRDLEAENAKLRAAAPAPAPAPAEHGHSTAEVAGAAVVGAAAGAAVAHAADSHAAAEAEHHAPETHAAADDHAPAHVAADTHADTHHH